MSFYHIDCFSGVGGFCTGLKAAGFTTLLAIEKVKSCVESYKSNHRNVNVIFDDIRNVNSDKILQYINGRAIDLVTVGMPCETFSTAGNRSRSFYDDRQLLFKEGIRIASIVNARFLLFENVPAITTKKISKQSSKLIIDLIHDELIKSGFNNFIEIILNALDFGVPQKRNRFFILATKNDKLQLSYPIGDNRNVTVKDAFAGLINVIPNSRHEEKNYNGEESLYSLLLKNSQFWRLPNIKSVTYHMPMQHRRCTIERFKLLRQGESLKDLFERYTGQEREYLQKLRILPQKMFIKRNYRLKYNEASPTVTSHCLDEFVHPKFNRALTVRECARLQSFPDAYDFCGGPYLIPHIDKEIQDKYEQIGDAVPPLLAYAWGKKIITLLKHWKI